MNLFKRKKVEETRDYTTENLLLDSGVISDNVKITKEQALNIPAVSGCINLIADTIAQLDVELYKNNNGDIEKIKDDVRVKLLNDDTKDTLNAYEFKKALIIDYLLDGKAYAYINKKRNAVESLHYIDSSNVMIMSNNEIIFKRNQIMIQGQNYEDWQFIKILRNSKDGATGKGIIDENNKLLSVAYNTLIFEDILVRKGGNKKGFLKSKNKLNKEALDGLKESWRALYSNNKENMMVLNDGLEFQESSNTSVEMQLAENKKDSKQAICNIFNVPINLLDGKATEEEYKNYIKICILPILKAFITTLNRNLLLEVEKDAFYFTINTKDLLKGDLESRYKAYEIGLKNSFLTVNEIRYFEDLKAIEGFDNIVKINLGDVLYNTDTKEIYTPNTDKTNDMKGGETDENRDKE